MRRQRPGVRLGSPYRVRWKHCRTRGHACDHCPGCASTSVRAAHRPAARRLGGVMRPRDSWLLNRAWLRPKGAPPEAGTTQTRPNPNRHHSSLKGQRTIQPSAKHLRSASQSRLGCSDVTIQPHQIGRKTDGKLSPELLSEALIGTTCSGSG